MRQRALVVIGAASLSLLVHAVACVGDDPAIASATDDAAVPMLDATSGDGAADRPEPTVPETPCDPSEKPGSGLFVSPAGDDTSGDGSAAAPYRSLTRALSSASTAGAASTIYADVGSYPEEVVVPKLTSDVSVRGGWRATGQSWMRACDSGRRALTVVRSTTVYGLHALEGGAALTIEDFTILTRATPVAALPGKVGETAYGVFVRSVNARLTLRNVEVRAGDGGGGVKPPTPARLPTPSSCTCKPTGVGASGLEGVDPSGLAPAAAQAGDFTADGFVPSSGAAGLAASNAGENGGPPGAQIVDAQCDLNDCNSACSCAKTTNTPTPSCVNYISKTSGAGACGCGGPAGAPGAAGPGGGASIALFVAGMGAKVTLDHVLLATGKGGGGAGGGVGGAGGIPTAGVPGSTITCYPNRYCWNMGPGCTNVDVPGAAVQHTASTGGNGGKGGAGQSAGAGAGGSVAGIVKVGGSVVEETLAAIALKQAGLGGLDAPAGEAVERVTKN